MKQDKKEIIREAAIEVIARSGFYNTRADQIAEEAGVAVGTIYNYFSNKEEILEYIFEVELKKRLTFLAELKESDADIWERMRLFLQRHFAEIRQNPKVGEILVKEKQFPHRENSAIIGYLNMIPLKIAALLEEGAQKGQVRQCNYTISGASFFGAIQGIVELAIRKNDLTLLENAAEELTNLWQQGLRP